LFVESSFLSALSSSCFINTALYTRSVRRNILYKPYYIDAVGNGSARVHRPLAGVRYVKLNPFDVNDDVIFLFTFYKHCRKQISAASLKPNIEVTSSTHYYEIFLSFDSSDRAYIYARIYDFSCVRKFCE